MNLFYFLWFNLLYSYKNIFILENVRAGYNLGIEFYFYLIDYYGTIFPITSQTVSIKDFINWNSNLDINNSKIFYVGKKISVITNNSFFFENIVVFGNIGSIYNLSFSIIPNFILENKFASNYSNNENVNPKDRSLSFVLPIKISGCERGEFFNSISNLCMKCPKGFYSFYINDTCRLCNSSMICLGGDKTKIVNRFWRDNQLTYNTYMCYGSGHGCKGGNLTSEICAKGYKSRLCSKCNLEYFIIGTDSYCFKCNPFFWVFVIFKIICCLIFFKLFRNITSIKINLPTLHLIKIVLFYLAQSVLINEMVFENNPDFFLYYSLIFQIISNHYSWLSFECIFPLNSKYKLVIFFIFVIWFLIYLTFVALQASHILDKGFRSKAKKKEYVQTIKIAYCSFLNISPIIIFIGFRSISCKRIEKKLFMLQDLDVNCNENFYMIFSKIVIAVLIIIIAIPSWIIIYYNSVLGIKGKKFDKKLIDQIEKKVRSRVFFQIISNVYTKNYWYWDFVAYYINILPFIYFGFYRSEGKNGVMFSYLIFILEGCLTNIRNVYQNKEIYKFNNNKIMMQVIFCMFILLRIFIDKLTIPLTLIFCIGHFSFFFYSYYYIRKFIINYSERKKQKIIIKKEKDKKNEFKPISERLNKVYTLTKSKINDEEKKKNNIS